MNGEKFVYAFNGLNTEGNKDMKDLLGGKGANLAEMSSLGLPVPPGFTITTKACLNFEKDNGILTENLKTEIKTALNQVEKITGKKFGDSNNPLLFSVRSGARASMPGMMDTVLNLGLNDEAVEGLSKLTGNARFAWDSYRRFIQMYSNVVMGFNTAILESTLEDMKEAIPERNFQPILWNSYGNQFRRFLILGKILALENIGSYIIYLTIGELRLTFNPWSLEIWGIPQRREFVLLETHQPEKKGSLANF
jgi:Pyruvate phosphate dikinase, AMP/ATP-binding domain